MVDGVSCILDFAKFSGEESPDPPPYKRKTSIKPSKSFFKNSSSQRPEKRAGKPLIPH